MLFNSLPFIIFFSIVYSLYLLLNHKWQNRLLLAASYVFYGVLDWRFLGLLLFSTTIDYFCGLKIAEAQQIIRRRFFLFCSIVCNLIILGFFKYFNFFVANINALLSYCGINARPIDLHIILPVGISFYTFKTLSYTIDIYRNEFQPTKNFFDYALFVSFFPNILAGPIDRAKDFLPQISNPRKITRNAFSEGCYLFYWGLFQKVFIADNLTPLVDNVFNNTALQGGFNVLLALYAFALQVFCDFDGYSNMARGIGKVMGFDIMVNFNMPYIASTLSEFWRRWHISLSNWFRDYVYTPLTIATRYWGISGTLFSLFITFLLIGLWHGAEWKFILFGLLQGLFISCEILTRRLKKKISGRHTRAFFTVFGVAITFHFFCFCSVFFKAPDIIYALELLKNLYKNFFQFYKTHELLLQVLLFSCPFLALQVLQYKKNDLLAVLRLNPWIRGFVYFVFYYLLVTYGFEGGKEFVYFKF